MKRMLSRVSYGVSYRVETSEVLASTLSDAGLDSVVTAFISKPAPSFSDERESESRFWTILVAEKKSLSR